MKKKVKEQWVKALRSGEIHKHIGALRKGDRMCALGVLCNVHAQHHPKIAAKQKLKSQYMGEYGTLPEKVRIWAGLNERNPSLIHEGISTDITWLNDGRGLSFKKIADLIEEQL